MTRWSGHAGISLGMPVFLLFHLAYKLFIHTYSCLFEFAGVYLQLSHVDGVGVRLCSASICFGSCAAPHLVPRAERHSGLIKTPNGHLGQFLLDFNYFPDAQHFSCSSSAFLLLLINFYFHKRNFNRFSFLC